MTEVQRHAKVGEYVRIVKSDYILNRYKVGEIHKVVRLLDEDGWKRPGHVFLDCGGIHAIPSEYVVLEGYDGKAD